MATCPKCGGKGCIDCGFTGEKLSLSGAGRGLPPLRKPKIPTQLPKKTSELPQTIKPALDLAKSMIPEKGDLLKQKFPAGSVFGKKAEAPKKDLLAGMVETGGFFENVAKEAGREEYGRGGEKQSIFGKIKGGFGKAKGKYSEWSAKRSEAARKKNYFTVRKCPKCGQMHTGAEPCPATGKPEATPADEEVEKIKEFYAGEKRIGLNTKNIGAKIAGMVFLGLTMAGAYFGSFMYFPQYTQPILILGGITVAFLAISMFVKNAGGYITAGLLGSFFFVSWQFGYVDPYTIYDKVMVAADPLIQTAKITFLRSQCMLSNPANYQACIAAVQQNKTESVNKLGPYETVELKWGRRLDGSYDTDPVESGQDYTLDVSFFNKNKAVYEINFTEINAYTTITIGSNPPVTYNTTPKSAFTEGRYTLDPEEELPIRFKIFDLPDDWSCVGSQTFKVNATTEQKSGGWSDFGIAPSDEDKFRNFIHKFNPHINAEPGPLNIYVYTDPWGISAEDFIDVTGDDRAEVIIKIQNKVKTGTAEIDKLYLVQNFEMPTTLFTIDITDCSGTGRLIVTPMQIVPIVPIIPIGTTIGTTTMPITNVIVKREPVQGVENCAPNCLEFTFNPTLKIKPGGKITISCKLDVNELPPAEYTDQIRVFADFRYIQEWTNPIPCYTG